MAVVLLAALPLLGCATGTATDDGDVAAFEAANDPAEGLNRGVFTLNRGVDTMVLKPAATAYRDLLPPPVQTGVHNFLNNLRSPIILIHDLLQGNLERAGDTTMRFFINTTVGILGVRDQAADWGIPFHDEDFGQTLAVWGVGEGPYVMLPLLGPSNPRDTVGTVVDFLADPISLLAGNTGHGDLVYARTGSAAVDGRASKMQALDDLEAISLDFYSATRSAYRQNRNWEIANGDIDSLPPGPSPELDLSDFEDGPSPAADQVAALPPPAAAPEPAEASAETVVPLALYDSFEEALAAWETLAARHANALGAADPVFTEIETAAGTPRIRLSAVLPRAMPPAQAERLVASLAPIAPPESAVAAATPVPSKPVQATPPRRAYSAPAANLVALIPAAPPAPPSTRVHIASFSDRAEAEAAWGMVRERFGATLGAAAPAYEPVTVGGRSYVRLLAVLPMVEEEEGLCRRLSAESAFCRVVEN